LVTNAVAASRSVARGLPVRLWLLCDKARVLIVVWDGCPQAPVRIDAGGDEESGRGLLLVETISGQWGSPLCCADAVERGLDRLRRRVEGWDKSSYLLVE